LTFAKQKGAKGRLMAVFHRPALLLLLLLQCATYPLTHAQKLIWPGGNETEALIRDVQERFAGNKISVLQNVTSVHIHHEPYPHIVISPALPEDLYEALDRVFPSLDDVLHAASLQPNAARYKPLPNTRHKIQAPQALGLKPGAENLHPLWKRFNEYHTSPAFYDEMVALLGEAMAKSKGNGVLPSSDGFKGAGIRSVSPKGTKSVVLDCQISMNTPPSGAHTTVRGAHLDAGEEIYAGLLYFRAPMDTCVGGDLEVIKCRRKDHKCIKLSDKVRAYYAKKGLAGLQFHPRDMETISTVKYEANTLVFFVNSNHAFHAVTTRTPTPYPRRFVNIVAQLP